MPDVIVETGGLTAIQTQIANAIMAMLEGFEYEDALAGMLAVLAACLDEGSESPREAKAVAEALADALIDMVGKAR